MKTMDEIARACRGAYEFVSAQPGVRECEVKAAANQQSVARLNWTTHIPCNGVEEPKSADDFGVGLQVVLDTPDGMKIGSGSEANDLTKSGIEEAYRKAILGAVHDPQFVSLARLDTENGKRTLFNYHDPAIAELSAQSFVGAGWNIIQSAQETFARSGKLRRIAVAARRPIPDLGLIVGGDVTVIAERFAIASTHHSMVQTDESTMISAYITAMVEELEAKGYGFGTYARLADFSGEAGADAAENAIAATVNERVPSGLYNILFRHQPVADFINQLLAGQLSLETFYAGMSGFQGKLGARIMDPRIRIYDNATDARFMGAKGITCEGFATARVPLVEHGNLVGLLANWYENQRIRHDPEGTNKLGINPEVAHQYGMIRPLSGFNFETGGGRSYGGGAGIAGTNLIFEGTETKPFKELVREMEDGLIVGHIWYTYPINGYSRGDFTCTVTGDSYIVRGGKIVSALTINSIRLNDNIFEMLNRRVLGIGDTPSVALCWAADEMPVASDILVKDVRAEAIAEFLAKTN